MTKPNSDQDPEKDEGTAKTDPNAARMRGYASDRDAYLQQQADAAQGDDNHNQAPSQKKTT